jgi:hypothetical protein
LGTSKWPTLANMHNMEHSHLDEEIDVELDGEEQNIAIENAALLKEGVASFKKDLTDLKKKKAGLLQANAAAKAEVLVTEKEAGHHRKPIQKGIEAILAKQWNIERPSWHGGDILGDECRKSMAFARLICNKMKVFLLEELDQNEGSTWAKREVSKRCDIIAKCLPLFDGFLSI